MIIPNYADGTITAADGYVEAVVEDSDTVAIQVYGTWVGTLGFDSSVVADQWADQAVKASSQTTATTLVTTTTGNGVFLVDTKSVSEIRVYADAWTSGTANVRIRASRSSK